MSPHYLVKCKKSLSDRIKHQRFLSIQVISVSLDKTDSRCHNKLKLPITFTYFLAYCFVLLMKVKVNNNNRFFSHPPNNLLFSKPSTFSQRKQYKL